MQKSITENARTRANMRTSWSEAVALSARMPLRFSDGGFLGRGFAAILCGFALIAASLTADAQTPWVARQSDWSMTVVSDGLSYPWELNRSGDTFILTEASGHIAMIENGRLVRHAVATSDAVANEGGSGLLGMALSADFKTSGQAYLYYTYRSGSNLANKVVEARFDGRSWRETRVLLSGIPGHRLYNGGRVGIGPDGCLYVTTGWVENGRLPQDLGSLAGKVLRMTRDGQVPADNPFKGSFVYSYGHRNPQGLAWNPSGELLVAEHGQIAGDEINVIRPGANYGWPLAAAGTEGAGMQKPLVHSGRDTWAPSGIAFAGDELLVAALGKQALYVFDEKAGALRQVFSSGDRIRQVLADGKDIYLITTNRSPRSNGPSADRLLKLTPTTR